jgi:aminoglycoside phosphotransferase (APT) family kinase protein
LFDILYRHTLLTKAVLRIMQGRVVSDDELASAERFGKFCPVFKVDATTIVKTGDSVRLTEATTMQFVREHTAIPVPEIYNAYRDEKTGHVRIITEYVEGDCLEHVWDKLNPSEKDLIIQQLRNIFLELRELKGTFIGGIDNTACEDQLFTSDLGGYGPYDNEKDFNDGIVTALKRSQQGPWVDMVSEMILKLLQDHKVVLTHGDFAPRNVLVQGTKVVAVLDWELSGYYPEYWEYVKALWRPAWESAWSKDRAVDQILQSYLSELAVVWHTRDIIW